MTDPDDLHVFFCVAAASLGAVVGSFLNVCIWRLPRQGIGVNNPSRSHCPRCGGGIRWYDNLPLASWLILGGRCRRCRSPISVRYFLVEALTAWLFAVLALEYLQPTDLRVAEFLVLAVLLAALVVASFVDIDLKILPDEITLSGMMLLPAVLLAVPGLHASSPDPVVFRVLTRLRDGARVVDGALPDSLGTTPVVVAASLVAGALGVVAGLYGYRTYWRLAHPRIPKPLRDGALSAVLFGSAAAVSAAVALRSDWALSPPVFSFATGLLGMAVGSGLLLGVGIVGSLVFRRAAMGFGDVKLMGLLGGVVGWGGVLAGFALACLLGSIVGVVRLVRYRTRYLWFGPFLSLGCVLWLLFPGVVRAALAWYLQLFEP